MEELELEYSKLQEKVEELLPGDFPLTFQELMEGLMSGEAESLGDVLGVVWDWLLQSAVFPWQQGVQLLLLVLFSALFANLSKAFSKDSTSHIGLLCVHLLLAVYAASGFLSSLSLAREGMDNLCGFVMVLLPTYCISITVVTGSVTAAGYYQGTAFLLGLFELLGRFCLLPLSQMYLVLSVASCIQKKPVFEKLLELLITLFGWIRKTLLALALAFGAVQGILCPAIDQLKRNTVVQSAAAIPGVGGLVGGAWETVLGAGAVLRNAIGLGGVFVLFLIAAIPLLQLAMQYLMYRVLAAVTEPVALEMTGTLLQHAGVAHRLLLQALFLGVVLFLLLLVIMTRIMG